MAPAPSGPVLEGVFAINKPPAISSAQVIRDIQQQFTPSKLFAPWLYREQRRKHDESHNQKQKRRSWKSRQPLQVKMGHGGTLDPMATGVLILGVGSGTKSLNGFLECTKSYDCVLLFGLATDSYDTEGKVVMRKPYEHITRERVEEAVKQFRGKIMQRPPIFSALKVNGKKLYEYAREGKEPPKAIVDRPVTVEELEVVQWYGGGRHEWRWPETEAEQVDKEVLEKLEHGKKVKRKKREDEDGEETISGVVKEVGARKKVKSQDEPVMSGQLQKVQSKDEPVVSGALPAETSVDEEAVTSIEQGDTSDTSSMRCPAPAVRLRMTVTSGFYVRSLCHDLATALDSAGCMASLSRTRQGDFVLGGETVLMYEDLGKGEEVWGEKVEGMLKRWQEKKGAAYGYQARDGAVQQLESASTEVDGEAVNEDGDVEELAAGRRVRRNTSSEEE